MDRIQKKDDRKEVGTKVSNLNKTIWSSSTVLLENNTEEATQQDGTKNNTVFPKDSEIMIFT